MTRIRVTGVRAAVGHIRRHHYRCVSRIALLLYAVYLVALWLAVRACCYAARRLPVACVRLLTSMTRLPVETSPTGSARSPRHALLTAYRRTRRALVAMASESARAAGFAEQGGASRRSTKATSSPQLAPCGSAEPSASRRSRFCGVCGVAALPFAPAALRVVTLPAGTRITACAGCLRGL